MGEEDLSKLLPDDEYATELDLFAHVIASWKVRFAPCSSVGAGQADLSLSTLLKVAYKVPLFRARPRAVHKS